MRPITVKSTTIHKYTELEDDVPSFEETIVTEGKLVLVGQYDWTQPYFTEAGRKIRPIIISETETIGIDDVYLYKSTFLDGTAKTQEDFNSAKWHIDVVTSHGLPYVNRAFNGINASKGIKGVYKMLVPTEQFSEIHLQAMVEGKLKDGDKVLVECETIERDAENWYWPTESVTIVKLNSEGHVTLFPAGEHRTVSDLDIKRIFEVYKPPFRYDIPLQAIVDANDEVATTHVRGWAFLQKLPDAIQIQDNVGMLITELLNKEYERIKAG